MTNISIRAFSNCTSLDSVTIYNPEVQIVDYKTTLGTPDFTTIYGYTGSTAEAYAKKYGYKFTALDAADTRGDMDGSGTITADDAQYILMYAVKKLAGLNPEWSEIIK